MYLARPRVECYLVLVCGASRCLIAKLAMLHERPTLLACSVLAMMRLLLMLLMMLMMLMLMA